MKILLKNGSVKGEKVLDILIENDKIIKIGAPNTIKDNEAEITVYYITTLMTLFFYN